MNRPLPARRLRTTMTAAPAVVLAWALAAAALALLIGSGAEAPPKACLDLLDQLSKGVPRDESGPALRARGLRIRTPIVVPDTRLSEGSGISGARVRVLIDAQGRVVPDSVQVQERAGDPKLAEALPELVPQTLSFDTRAAPQVPEQFAFTTVYVSCGRR
ncbi:hypothetical protein ABXN37_04825 [Piscinibacter sakaiensis]|uniref:hypothetical protein n=1 Tax=Piscinibacter sakaiensis TaxID=1547922 RepID=UPI00372C5332